MGNWFFGIAFIRVASGKVFSKTVKPVGNLSEFVIKQEKGHFV